MSEHFEIKNKKEVSRTAALAASASKGGAEVSVRRDIKDLLLYELIELGGYYMSKKEETLLKKTVDTKSLRAALFEAGAVTDGIKRFIITFD